LDEPQIKHSTHVARSPNLATNCEHEMVGR
jgi:hypothetical protein